jgi:hypothetical protein
MKKFLLIAIPLVIITLFVVAFLTKNETKPQVSIPETKLGAGKPFDKGWQVKLLPDFNERLAMDMAVNAKFVEVGDRPITVNCSADEDCIAKFFYERYRVANTLFTTEEKAVTLKQLVATIKGEDTESIPEGLLGAEGDTTIGDILEQADNLDLTVVD